MSPTRREVLTLGAATLASLRDLGAHTPAQHTLASSATARGGRLVNDIHSQLNATHVAHIARPATVGELADAVRAARRDGVTISVAGGRHAMGGQQFGAGTLLVDMNELNRIVGLDTEHGIVEAEGGIQWPALLDGLAELQRGAKALIRMLSTTLVRREPLSPRQSPRSLSPPQ